MKKILLVIALLISNSFLVQPAQAVLGGLDGTNSKFVVPINGSASSCSGVLLNPRLAVTAGHCTRNKDDQPDAELYVGPPGVDRAVNKTWVKVSEIIVQPNFNFAYRGIVPLNDIAFLVLSAEINEVAITRVAEAADLPALNGLGPVLQLHGYGYKGEGDIKLNSTSTPLIGNFYLDSFAIFDPTLQGISSKNFSACNGDSGAPVIYQKNNEVILVGINVGGGGLRSNCRSVSSSGNYSTEIQLLHKHSQIYLKALNSSIKGLAGSLQTLTAKSKVSDDAAKLSIETLQSQLASTKREIEESIATQNRVIEGQKVSLTEAQARNAELEAEILALKQPKVTSLICTKGKSFTIVKKINPVCPKGFKAN